MCWAFPTGSSGALLCHGSSAHFSPHGWPSALFGMRILVRALRNRRECRSYSMAEPAPGSATLICLLIFIAASVWLGTLANRIVKKSSFLQGYFLGNRGLGAWALALTATVQSGGTFMGFPSLVYSHGWVLALWIGSYMVVPITAFGILGKRLG